MKALRQAGFTLRHMRGSHHIMTHAGPPARMVAVPVHANKTLPPGTLSAIIEEAGLTAEEFSALL